MSKKVSDTQAISVRHFSRTLASCFDAANRGEAVTITRSDKVFVLRLSDKVSDKVSDTPQKVSDTPPANRGGNVSDTLPRVSDTHQAGPYQFCKHNAVKGFCKKRNCK